MATLIRCKDCGKDISRAATVCPHCGKPQKKQTSGCAWVALIGMVFFFGMVIIGTIANQSNAPHVAVRTPRPVPPTPTSAQSAQPTATPEPPAATPTPAQPAASAEAPIVTPAPSATPGEATRKEIYIASGESETRAIHDADLKFPEFGENHQKYAEKQTGLYRQDIMKKYDIPEDVWSMINLEGALKRWGEQPTPTPNPTIVPTSQTRKDQIGKLFSAWDGSHRNFVRVVKESMNNPKSYDHVSTQYKDMGSYLLLEMVFRGTNKLNAIVKNTCYAKSTLDGKISELSCE